jgi:hypothetical protein
MSRYIIIYVEEIKDTISIEFCPNKVLNGASEDYQAIYFPASRTVYLSDKRWEEFCQMKTMADKREFFQHRVWHYNQNFLGEPKKMESLLDPTSSLEATLDKIFK